MRATVKAGLGMTSLAVIAMVGAQAWANAAPKPRALRRPVAASHEPACSSQKVPQLADQLPFGPGESLRYVVTINGANAAEVDIALKERINHDGRLAYPAFVTARSNPIVSLWTKMDAELTTVLDPDASVPLNMKSKTHGEKFTYEEDIRFNAPVKRIEARTIYNGKPWNGSLTSETDVLDALSLMYYARSRELRAGAPFCLELYQSRVLWRVRGAIEGKETVETDAGPFEAWKARGVASIAGRHGPKAYAREYTAWMTDDDDRIPVLLKAPTPLGEVVVKLVRFEQGRRLARARPAPPGQPG